MFHDSAVDRVKSLRLCDFALKSWLVATAFLTACAGAPEKSAAPAKAAVPPRRLGSWTGSGNTTLGFTSESGSFRVDWRTRDLDAQRPGTFELTLRSGISGRPLQVIADHEGSGWGAVDFGDDPRLYEFLVESNGVEWSIAVHETYAPARKR
jgi:outer membrane biogenesis lipoprotein LolB